MTIARESWGRIPYREAWVRQRAMVERRARDEIPDTFVFCEHDPVITLGRGAQRDASTVVRRPGVEVLEIERGGLATYHGPGQLVVYPIVKLASGGRGVFKKGVVELIRALENWTIDYLGTQSLRAEAIPGKTGVWVIQGPVQTSPQERKIASIGIAVRHWVSYHGIALNVSTGQEPWTWIDPCGFDASVMTDLDRETGQPQALNSVADGLWALRERHFQL